MRNFLVSLSVFICALFFLLLLLLRVSMGVVLFELWLDSFYPQNFIQLSCQIFLLNSPLSRLFFGFQFNLLDLRCVIQPCKSELRHFRDSLSKAHLYFFEGEELVAYFDSCLRCYLIASKVVWVATRSVCGGCYRFFALFCVVFGVPRTVFVDKLKL